MAELLDQRQRAGDVRDGDLYFEDGNIVLSARGAGGSLVYFRLHRSVLSRACSVFRDMFTIPPPPEMDLYDGIPLVFLHDSGEELKAFIQAMYDPSYLPFLRLRPDTSGLLAGPLKLATKYDAGNLRSRIISYLKSIWPITLRHWDELVYAKSASYYYPDEIAQTPTHELEPDQLTIDFCHNPDLFISLARECNFPRMFATALYSLCCHSERRREKLSRLPRDDLQDLLLGRESMLKATTALASAILELDSWVIVGPGAGCDGGRCHPFVVAAWSDIMHATVRVGDPLGVLREMALQFRGSSDQSDIFDTASFRASHRICPGCKTRMADELTRIRQTLFNALPSCFPLRNGGFASEPPVKASRR